MAELAKYAYLFEGKGTGGANLSNDAKGKEASLEKIAISGDQKAYRAARKAQK